jgi:hypothetical protein
VHLPSLLITLALLLAGPAQAGSARSLPAAAPDLDEEVALTNRFFDAGYSYCDARVLAHHWGQELWDSKVRAGRTLARNGTARLRVDLGAAQARVSRGEIRPCEFYDTGFEAEQALALAALWSVSAQEAKAKVAWAASTGGVEGLRAALASAGAQAPTASAEDRDHLATFLASDTYDYCHAKMVGALWGGDVRQAKATIGLKLDMGWTDSLAMLLERARENARQVPQARCTFQESPFLYEDAAALARLWGVDTAQAKARVEQKYLDGTEGVIRQELARAGRR